MESEGWKMRVVCVIWREDEVEEEEMKSRRRRRKEREREREREREQEGLPVLLFFVFLFRLGRREGAPQGQNTHVTVPYGHTPVTPWSIPPESVVWYCHPSPLAVLWLFGAKVLNQSEDGHIDQSKGR